MRHLLSTLGLVALLAGTSGCVINAGDGGDGIDPDMKLDVTFGGLGCEDANVGSVQLTFVNPVVGPPQTFPCTDNQALLIDVPTLAPGTYRVQLDAFDATTGDESFGGTFDIDHTEGGTHENALDLASSTEVVADFTFAGAVLGDGSTADGMTCAEAGIATIHLNVDGTDFTPVDCTNQGRDAASLPTIQPGSHTFVVDGYDAGGNKLYSSRFPNLAVQAGSNEFTFDLLPVANAAGGMDLAWTFDAQQLGCADAGVSYVDFQLVDQTGTVVYDTQSDQGSVACSSAPAKFTAASGLAAGVYALNLVGENAGGTPLYEADNVRVFAPVGLEPLFTVNAPPKQ